MYNIDPNQCQNQNSVNKIIYGCLLSIIDNNNNIDIKSVIDNIENTH